MSVSYKGKKISLPVIAYGGMVHSNYMMGMINLVNKLAALGMNVSCPSIWFESLISRARNASAAAALSNKDDYLMFIDTDVIFDANDVVKLIDADKDVAVGLYPKKYISDRKVQFLSKKYSQMPAFWRQLVGDFSSEFDNKVFESNENLIEVNYAATGFMLIKTSVFNNIAKAKPDLKYKNDIDGYMSYGDNFFDFFRCWVNPDTKKYESEDYGFCKVWQECGGKIHALTDIKLKHRGNIEFEGDFNKQREIFYK